MLIYMETEYGCCIRKDNSLKDAYIKELVRVGTNSGIKVCRKATKEGIAWVEAMGGNIQGE